MADSEIIISLTIEGQKKIEELTKEIDNLKNTQKELDKAFVEGGLKIEEYNNQSKENTKSIKTKEQAVKSLTTATQAEAGSISALSARNKELLKERNSITTSTQEGRDKIAALNKQIDENNELIKSNVSGLEKQRLNIGNYKSALEGIGGSLKSVVPGLGGMTNGLSGITAGAKAFTATPFGATLQIIAGLLSVLIEAFKGSEEGQRNLNKITQVTSALFGALGEIVREIGGFLIDAFKNPKQTMMDLVEFLQNNIINRFKAFGVIIEGIKNLDFKQVSNGVLQFGSGVENVIGKIEAMGQRVVDVANKALEQGQKVAELQAMIEDMEDEAKLKRAKNDLEVSKLRERAIKEEGETRRKTIEQAIAIERQSANESVKLAQKRVELAQLELQTAKDKKAATDALEDAEVALVNAQAERYNATLRFEKQLEALREQEKKQAEIDAQFTEEAIQARQDKELQDLINQLDKENQAKADADLKNALREIEENEALNKAIAEQDEQFRKKSLADEEKYNQQRKNAENTLRNVRQQAALDSLNFISSLLREGSKAQKVAALAEVAAGVGIGFINALDIAQKGAKATGPGAPLAFPIFYASQISAVLAAAARARAIIQSGNSSSAGTSIGGGRSGVTQTQATTNPINQSFASANAFRNMPPVIASWKEASEVRNRVEFKESLTTV